MHSDHQEDRMNKIIRPAMRVPQFAAKVHAVGHPDYPGAASDVVTRKFHRIKCTTGDVRNALMEFRRDGDQGSLFGLISNIARCVETGQTEAALALLDAIERELYARGPKPYPARVRRAGGKKG